MRIKIAILLLFFGYITNAQNHININIGITHPVLYSDYNILRKYGCEFGISYQKFYTDNLFAEIGFNIGIYGRCNLYVESSNVLIFPDTISIDLGEKIYIVLVEEYIPLMIGFKFKDFAIKGGGFLQINPITFTNYSGYDPEIPQQYEELNSRNKFYFGLELNATYDLTKRIKPFFDFKYNFSKKYYHCGLVNIGLIFVCR